MDASDNMIDSAPEKEVNDSCRDDSKECENQSEAMEETSDVQQNNLDKPGEKEDVLKVIKVSISKPKKARTSRVQDHFCKLCEQSFTRAQSLSRHNERKHSKSKDPIVTKVVRPKRARTNTDNVEDLSDENETIEIENANRYKSQPKRKMKPLKIMLSSKIKVAKTGQCGRNNFVKGSVKASDDCPMIEEELAAVQTLKDACEKLQSVGQQVLVITSNGQHAQWFGSNYGVNFAQDNPEVVGSFFNYCKDKEEAWRQEMKITIKSECESADNVEMGNHENTTDSYTGGVVDDVDDEDGINDDDDGDDDDDYGCDEEEKDNDGNDDFKDNERGIKLGRHKLFAENRDKCFQEIAENLCAHEDSRDASIVVKKRNGKRRLVYTVAQLNRGEYHCPLCGYKFLWKCHLDLHQAKNPYCVQKNYLTVSENDIWKESITFYNNQNGVQITSTFQELIDSQKVDPLSCAVCGKTGFSNRGKLKEHIIIHNESSLFECNICNSAFTSTGLLSSHLKEHFKKSYECHSCQWKFTTEMKLKQHANGGCRSVSLIDDKNNIDLGLNEIPYKCSICCIEIVGLGTLRKHLEVEHDKQFRLYECIICSRHFSCTGHYKRHMLEHKYQVSCPFCPKTFSSKSNMFFIHVKSHRSEPDFPYVCDICGEKFKSKRYFDPHRRIHTGERPYICKVEGCGKSFRSPDSLDQHKWCHSTKHFICDFCGRKFKKPSLLNNHLKTHTEDWRYPCIYCELKFKKLRPFKRHLAREHPSKVEDVKEKFKIILHACDECPRVFFDKEDHTAHVSRHRGIKPFPCNICDKKFSDKSNLLNHAKGHFGGKKLKCSVCSRKFNTEKYLQDHIARLHSPRAKVTALNDENKGNHDNKDEDEGSHLTIAISEEGEDIDQLRESTLQIIDETIRGNVSFD